MMYGLNLSPCVSLLLGLAFKMFNKYKYWLLDHRIPPVLFSYIYQYCFISISEINPNISLQQWVKCEYDFQKLERNLSGNVRGRPWGL